MLPETEVEKYIIQIPKTAKKEDLHNLKDFLISQKPGNIPVYILLSGQEVDTKFSLASVEELEKWEEENLRIT